MSEVFSESEIETAAYKGGWAPAPVSASTSRTLPRRR
jgi:hypothetical protein